MAVPNVPNPERRDDLRPRSCAFCGKRFTPKRHTQVNCSESCRRRAGKLSRLIEQPKLTDRRCEWCGDRLTSTNPKTKFCSDSCRLSAFKAKPCFYCGAPATTRDHVIPRSFAKRLEDFAIVYKRNVMVPACVECNSTAGNQVFITIREKRQFILGRYQIRYKKLLESPYWTKEELDELGPTLRSHVVRSSMEQDFIRARMRRLSR